MSPGPTLGSQSGQFPALPPSSPSYGLVQQDFPYQENVDGTHPLNLDYFIALNTQRVLTARLSFRLRAYRTYSSLSLTTTGNESVTHTHTTQGETGHSHSHGHTIHLDGAGYAQAVSVAVGATSLGGGAVGPADVAAVNGNAQGSSGHTHNGNTESALHNHTVSGTSSLGVTEGAVATNVSVLFDGVDQSAALGGPFTTDQIELDVTKYISLLVDRSWHVIALQPTGLGRVQAVLRILYLSNLVQ